MVNGVTTLGDEPLQAARASSAPGNKRMIGGRFANNPKDS
jgi:hypothetical protein